jgi:hypothetical protein
MKGESFGFAPVFPLLQVAVLVLLAAVAAVWLYRREEPSASWRGGGPLLLALLRALVVTGVAALLLNPVWTRAEKETGKPPLLVLLDTSHSMAVPDVKGQPRFDAARRMLQNGKLQRDFGDRFTPVFFSVSESATRQDGGAFLKTARPDGAHTALGEAIAAAIGTAGSAPSGGVLLLSDGRNNGELSPVDVAKQAKARKFPVFTVCLGTSAAGRDVSLVNRRPQVYAAPKQEVSLAAEVQSAGYQGQRAQVDLLKAGKAVASRSVLLDDGKAVPVSFSVVEAKPGFYHYAMKVRPLPAEGSDANNRTSLFLSVLDSKIRVLVLEGRPTWDAKFLIQALHSDPSVEVDAIFKLTGDKFFAVKGTADPGALPVKQVKVPSTPAELAKYDVVVIGRGFEEFFTDKDAASLKQYVGDHAGNLIFLRGNPEERASVLQDLEPVRWSDEQVRDFRMQVTEEGRSNPAFTFGASGDPETVIQKLPTMISATRVEEEKALSVVLARASGVPGAAAGNKEMAVLAYQNYGQGKAVALIGQGLWRWAFLPPELKDYAGCYRDFWTQLVRWLVSQSDFLPGQDVSLKTDRAGYSPGETVNFMAFLRGKGMGRLPPLKIAGPSGKVSQLVLGKGSGSQADFAGAFKPREAGEYVATLALPGSRSGSVTAPFSVFETREEDIVTAADPQLMRQIAQAGGGEALSLGELDSLPQRLREAQSLLFTRTEPRPAWDRWWVLAALLGVLSLEWMVRRRLGMV